jgi:hypothetical protein
MSRAIPATPSAPAWHVTKRPLPSIMLTVEWSDPRNE